MNQSTILWVDDELNVLVTLRNQLGRYFPDYQIEIAQGGDEALELVEDLLSEGLTLPPLSSLRRCNGGFLFH